METNIRITKHKTLSLQSWYSRETVFMLLARWTRCTDHAGISIDLTILGRSLEIELYDNRHWDSERNRWQGYSREEMELRQEEL
jgi:hypothetical protein